MKVFASGSAADGLCIAILAAAGHCCVCHMSISFAPFSGHCFVELENDGPVMQTSALPSVCDALEGYVWVQITEKGSMRFLRQFGEGRLEDTGFLPSKMFPTWIGSYFAIVDFWGSDLEVDTCVSVEYSGPGFPKHLGVSSETYAELETPWTLFGEENW
jgi:hypothetical protein